MRWPTPPGGSGRGWRPRREYERRLDGARQRAEVTALPSPERNWEAVVGLEIHVHLKTRTKMFCRCETGFGAPENTHTCPVCLAHPGALPVANGTAVEWTIKLGLALGSEIAKQAVFSRKNYFY